jgi:hypothetical protein
MNPHDTNLGAWDAGQAGQWAYPGSREPDIKAPPPLTEAERNLGPMTDEEFRRWMPLCWRLSEEARNA